MNKKLHTMTVVEKRARRVRAKLSGTAARPRLTVFRSNRFTYLQVINDETGVVVASANDRALRAGVKKGDSLTKTDAATQTAGVLVEQLKKKKVTAVVMDRGSYKYHGRVKAVAEALRTQGINV